jgi:alanine racemase
MPASPHVTVRVDLQRIRRNVEDVRRRIGRAELHAVVKADAYGLGARRVAEAIRDDVDGFVVFSVSEALDAGLHLLGKPTLTLGPPSPDDPHGLAGFGIRSAVWTVAQVKELTGRLGRAVLSVDPGMQRFGCPPDQVEAVLKAGGCVEAFTHATRVEAARELAKVMGGRGLRLHAAGSALLDEPEAHLDLVRPGLALYRGAVSVSAPLVEVHETRGPAGYTGFSARRHGVILAGYSNGLRPGPCAVGGVGRRVVEVGMQTSFVDLGDAGAVGAPVTLLGSDGDGADAVGEDEVARDWGCTPHEALIRLARMGPIEYTPSNEM